MDPKKLFIDERMLGVCSYCGSAADSRDHVPSKVLLSEPYPDNLPVAESCIGCNQGFSQSEEYLACLIECVKNGTTVPNSHFRPSIAATLKARPAIAARIEASKSVDEAEMLIWQPESDRVKEVILKLARGHISYELGLQRIDEPVDIEITPIALMSESQLNSFMQLPSSGLWPELGSRAFVNILQDKPSAFEAWHVVQQSNYAYAIGQGVGDWVKIILGDYLACYVAWD